MMPRTCAATSAGTHYETPDAALIQTLARAAHCQASRLTPAEMRDRDNRTMHAILRGYATGHDNEHWRMREYFEKQVQGSFA